MALTEIPIELSSTPSIVDGGNATAITIDSSENVTFAGTATAVGLTVTSSSSNAGTFKAVGGYAVQAYQDATSANHTALELRSDHVSGGTDRYLIRGYNTAAGTPVESFSVNTAGGATFSSDVLVGTTSAPAGWGGSSPMIFLKPNSNTNGLVVLSGSSNNGIRFFHDGTTAVIDSTYGTGGSASASGLTFKVAGSAKGEFATNGSLYLYGQATGAGNADLRYNTSGGRVTYDTSSRLVKAEIEDIPYGLSTVMALSPKRYQRTDSDNKLEVGFIADEVVEVVPELVGMMEKRFLTMNQEDTEVVAGSVEYNKMTAVLVKAIQELKEELNTATARITELENN